MHGKCNERPTVTLASTEHHHTLIGTKFASFLDMETGETINLPDIITLQERKSIYSGFDVVKDKKHHPVRQKDGDSLHRVRRSCAWIFYPTFVHPVRKAETIVSLLYLFLELCKQCYTQYNF